MIKISHHVNDDGNDELHVEAEGIDDAERHELDNIFRCIVSAQRRRGQFTSSLKAIAEIEAEDNS